MQILLFRHGIAADAANPGAGAGQDDAARPLTEEGIRKTTATARGLATLIGRPDAILTSPRLRAVQTAEILSKALNRRVTTLPELGGSSPARLARRIKSLEGDLVVLVGHEPSLSIVTQMLCTGRQDESYLELKKAGCACVEVPRGKSTGTDDKPGEPRLLWLATPAMLRALAKD